MIEFPVYALAEDCGEQPSDIAKFIASNPKWVHCQHGRQRQLAVWTSREAAMAAIPDLSACSPAQVVSLDAESTQAILRQLDDQTEWVIVVDLGAVHPSSAILGRAARIPPALS